ncbi:hypothetical protein DMJ13_22155 [halophilic archaeon]|nr:hypothetical protein DMJ13_22155 [halophilic archaeon]
MINKLPSNFHESLTTTLTRRLGPAALVGASTVLMTGTAAAQNFCNTQGGQFAGAVQSGIGGLAIAFLVAMLLASVVLKAVPVKGTSKLGNVAIGGFFVGVAMIVLGLAFADFALGFAPVDASSSCGNILG